MPLPFAPPPDESRVYDSLKSVLLSDVTSTQLDSLRSTVFAQGTDGTEDEFRRLLLLGLASQQSSISGPIPGSFKIALGTTSSSGSIVTAFTPNAGEVWQIVAAVGGSGSGTTGTIYLEVKLYDIVNSRRVEWIATSTTTGTDIPLTEVTQNPVYIDENCRLEVEATGTFTTYNFLFPMIRVR